MEQGIKENDSQLVWVEVKIFKANEKQRADKSKTHEEMEFDPWFIKWIENHSKANSSLAHRYSHLPLFTAATGHITKIP